MESLCLYNGKVYNIICKFTYNNNNFAICKDGKNLVYFKHNKVDGKDIYVPYERWIKAFEATALKDDKNKIDEFLKSLNNNKKNNAKYIRLCVDEFVNNRPKTKKINFIFNKYVLLLLVCLTLFSVGGVTLFNWYNEGKKVDNIMGDILENTKIEEQIAFTPTEIPEVTGEAYEDQKYGEDYWNYMKMTMMSVDFDELLKINSDTKGWIYINDTNVNYPFVQGSDNSYYLNHSFDKSYNVAGWLYADYKSNFSNFGKNTVIYGHGRVDQVMFGSLEKVLDASWYTNKENQIIKLSTPEKNTLWQIFSIYTVPSELYYLTHTFENDESYQKFLDTMKSRSVYDFGVSVDSEDKILTVSTCLDTNGNRIVIQAKLLKEQSR